MGKHFQIPESEIRFSFSRSSGPGGQNVNKLETKVSAAWDFKNSHGLTEEQKQLVSVRLKNKISNAGLLAVYSQSERSQTQNRAKAVELLNNLVNKALIIPIKRRPTKVTKAAKEKRLSLKKLISEKKKLRKNLEY